MRMSCSPACRFRKMWKDALAAYAFLVERGSDPGRVAFLGASVGCSVAIDAAAREPRIAGALVLTPGKNYLGIETMKHLKDYGDRPLLILSSKEEAGKGATAIAEELGDTAGVGLLDQTRIHGTMMFGKVPEIESRIVKLLSYLVGAGIAGGASAVDVLRGGALPDLRRAIAFVEDGPHCDVTGIPKFEMEMRARGCARVVGFSDLAALPYVVTGADRH